MATMIEIRERQKMLLNILLKIKKANEGTEVKSLEEEIRDAIVVMEAEDVAYVEKITGIKVL